MTTIAPPPLDTARRPADRTMAMKWFLVLAAMTIATVLDGISVSDLSRTTSDAMSSGEQAVITLPSDRCGPGCAIMVAANQTGDAFIARSE